jgi:hypothetical protein
LTNLLFLCAIHSDKATEGSVHAGPLVAPQRFNPAGIPTLGGIFQGAGALVVLNELSYVVALLLLLATKHITLPDEAREPIIDTAESLYNSVGAVDIANVESLLKIPARRKASPDAPHGQVAPAQEARE